MESLCWAKILQRTRACRGGKKITPDFSGATFFLFYFLAVAEFLAITFRISLRFARV
jgi:hypothetical protein